MKKILSLFAIIISSHTHADIAECAVRNFNTLTDYQIEIAKEAKITMQKDFPKKYEVLSEYIDGHLKNLERRKFMASETLKTKPELLDLSNQQFNILADGKGKLIDGRLYSYVHLHMMQNEIYREKNSEFEIFHNKYVSNRNLSDSFKESKKIFGELMSKSSYMEKIVPLGRSKVIEICK